LKTLVKFCMLVFLTSVASAEVYKWEDTEAMHFTDDPASVPDGVCRDEVCVENMEQDKNIEPQVIVEETNNQKRPVVTRKKRS